MLNLSYNLSVLVILAKAIFILDPIAFCAELSGIIWRNSNDRTGTKSFTHIEYRGRTVGGDRGFSELNPSPHVWLFTSVSVESSPRSYLCTSVTDCTKVWHKTYPMHDVPLLISARYSFAPSQKSRRSHRNYGEQKLYPVGFLCRQNRYRV